MIERMALEAIREDCVDWPNVRHKIRNMSDDDLVLIASELLDNEYNAGDYEVSLRWIVQTLLAEEIKIEIDRQRWIEKNNKSHDCGEGI